MSDAERMVVVNAGPVRIGDGPEISTRGADFYDMNTGHGVIRVDGEPVGVYFTCPEPFDIPGTPYEGYARGEWLAGTFAIRLKCICGTQPEIEDPQGRNPDCQASMWPEYNAEVCTVCGKPGCGWFYCFNDEKGSE